MTQLKSMMAATIMMACIARESNNIFFNSSGLKSSGSDVYKGLKKVKRKKRKRARRGNKK